MSRFSDISKRIALQRKLEKVWPIEDKPDRGPSGMYDGAKCECRHTEDRRSFRQRAMWVLSSVIFASFAGYWIYQVLHSYTLEPVTSIVSIVRSKTFDWPTITIGPSYLCFNQTALDEMGEKYNLTKQKMTYYDFFPFDLANSNFDWDLHNLSDILTKVKYNERTSLITRCIYVHGEIPEWDCYNETTRLGHWSSYSTQESPYHAFSPTHATNTMGYISIMINSELCKDIAVIIHPSNDKYYFMTPTSKYIYIHPGETAKLKIRVEEFIKENRRVSPCVEDPSYSQNECIDKKKREFLIKNAGCYMPAVSGYPTSGNYPECNNLTQWESFKGWFDHIRNDGSQYTNKDLAKEKSKCPDPCRTLMYHLTKNTQDEDNKDTLGNSSLLLLRVDDGALYFLQVQERFAMSIDMLIANIGGTLGLFLGASCFTAVTAVEYILKKTKIIL